MSKPGSRPDAEGVVAPDGTGSSDGSDGSDEGDLENLQSALIELSRLAMGSVEESLQRIALLTTRAVPGADGAGVTMLEAGRRETVGASEPFVTAVDDIQYRLDEGPCVLAAAQGRVVVSGAVGADPNWPRFGPLVTELGVNSVVSLPLLVDSEVVGALNVYAREFDVFDATAVAMGEVFATSAAVAVFNARLLGQADRLAAQLQAALTNRAVIDQAIGISMSRQGTTASEALERMRETSQARNVKMSVLAQQLVDAAVRRARARHSEP